MKHTLSNGVVVESTNRRSNRSGYTGAALSIAWTLDRDRPFIAACANPTDPEIMEQLRHQERTSWHGGHYSDAREAAYVTALFKADPVGTDHRIALEGAIHNFPADLYRLPVTVNSEQAWEILSEDLAEAQLKKSQSDAERAEAKRQKLIQKQRAEKREAAGNPKQVAAQGNLIKFFDVSVIRACAKSAGGAEQFQAKIAGLTVAQFAQEFGVELA